MLDGVREIPIEERSADEVTHVQGRDAQGRTVQVRITPDTTGARNPAFDVTPAETGDGPDHRTRHLPGLGGRAGGDVPRPGGAVKETGEGGLAALGPGLRRGGGGPRCARVWLAPGGEGPRCARVWLTPGAESEGRPGFRGRGSGPAPGRDIRCGVDEAGRGPLAGPVTAAAVRLDSGRLPVGLRDSKVMTAAQRERMFDWLMQHAAVSVAHASVAEIDALNILRASHLAMERAVAGLPADHALVDGNLIPKGLTCTSRAIVKGDARCLSIAAASVIAQGHARQDHGGFAQQHPQYGWEKNAGYPQRRISRRFRFWGYPFHRRSFAPVHNILCQAISVTP